MKLSRRQFLIRTGLASGGLVALSSCGFIPVLPTFATPEQSDAFAWVQIDENGQIRFYCPRAEMGQGIANSFAGLVAEELTLNIEEIEFVYPTTQQIAPTKMTVGSESVEAFAKPLATAAATLRESLRLRAAKQFSVDISEVEVRNGKLVAGDNSLSFAQLIAGKPLEIVEWGPDKPELQLLSNGKDFTGQVGYQKFDVDIVTGAETYSRDVFEAGMLFGAVARAPWLGAELEGFNEAAAAESGVVKIVRGPSGEVGIVAKTPMAARRGIAALACRWQTLSESERAKIDEINDVDITAQQGFEHNPVEQGDIKAAQQDAKQQINVRYDSPMTAHASMEPRSGVARIIDGELHVNTGSQDPWYVQGATARATGLQTVVQNHRMGGGFGGRIHCQASFEAAWLAKAVGQPVKVQWSREEEFNYNYAGPGFSHRIQAGVDQDGKINYWHHQMVGSPILTTSALIPKHLHWAADLVPDPGTWRGAETSYQIDHHRVEFSDIRRPMATGAWRGLGAAPNTYAVECAMDELAEIAELDPIEFRIKNAKDPRLVGVLKDLKSMLPINSDGYIGVAAGAYKGVTFVAVAAEVDDAGKLQRIWCSHDCGKMINSDRVKAQIEGCLVWGVGMATSENYSVKDGIGQTSNFHQYLVPRISDIPDIEIHMLPSTEPSSGAGEAAFPPATAAIVNAIAKVNGRQRSLPVS